MKCLVEVKYTVTERDYQTEHTSQTIYHAPDAIMCLVNHLNQLAADTCGVTDIQASVKEISLIEYQAIPYR